MPWPVFNVEQMLPTFLLVLFRVGGLTIGAPLVGAQGVPDRVKIALAVTLALMIFPVVMPSLPTELTLAETAPMVVAETMIGLSIGMAAGLMFLGVRVAGMIVGQQTGIALGQVFNPMLGGSTTIVGQVYFLLAMAAFLALGGHRIMIATLLDTYRTIPPGSYDAGETLPLLSVVLKHAYTVAIRLAGPAVIALFMATLAMGLLSRTIPQLNILSVGFAVRIMVGLAATGVSIGLTGELLAEPVAELFAALRLAFGLHY